MSEPPSPTDPQSGAQVRVNLQELSRLLRHGQRLDVKSRQALADLVDELNRAVGAGTLPPAETAHLAEGAARLAQALHHQHDSGMLAAARERFEEAIARTEAAAPLATGLARRFLDAVANLGI